MLYAYRQLCFIYHFEMTILAYNDFCSVCDMNWSWKWAGDEKRTHNTHTHTHTHRRTNKYNQFPIWKRFEAKKSRHSIKLKVSPSERKMIFHRKIEMNAKEIEKNANDINRSNCYVR